MGLPNDCGLELYSKYEHGKRNLITDVPDVCVGHKTLSCGDIQTGVTAVVPHKGNTFLKKVPAAAEVINGFGKSAGVIQIKELGMLETPIVMTNTLSVGTAHTALTRYMLRDNPDIGRTTGTVNACVTECNDGFLNDIRGLHVTEKDVFEALANASDQFQEGAVGSGTGMMCLGVKGGIGSASRILKLDGVSYTVGALVMTNFGAPGNLVIGGKHYDTAVLPRKVKDLSDKGSIISIIATDIPMSSRQLLRTARRLPIALGRTGSTMGNGSGDISIAFSTANRIPHYPECDILDTKAIHENLIDDVFVAAIEAIEESIISALWHAETTVGRDGNIGYCLRDYLNREFPKYAP